MTRLERILALVLLSLSSAAQTDSASDRKALFGELHMHTQWPFDAKELGIEHPPDLDKTIQERAYTSPIRYDRH